MTYLKEETDAIYAAYEAYEKALEKLQAECEHKTILESGRVYMTYFDDMPPLRICEDCGFEEESVSTYYSSFSVLKGRAYPVERQEIYNNRPKQTYIPKDWKK